jgi:hypothetical protein
MCDTCGCGQTQDPVAVPTDQPQTVPVEPVVPPTPTGETPVAPAEQPNPAPEAPVEAPADQPVGETTPAL